MNDALFSAVEVESSTLPGYRLRYLEIFNWGTFDQRVWRLTPERETTLLTGDIGSGKSTLVDALTTLLLPSGRIAYNKAAGASTKERTLRSYVAGHHKTERVESTGQSRAVGLRDHRAYTVVLGVFVNEGYDESVTLAQVFHARDRNSQPDRFFVTSTKQLGIEADFTDFGSNLNQLRRRLRSAGAEVFTTYRDYSRQVRKLLSIRSEQAMELFHQTVSMKSVGNLNEFVRHHMLEPADAESRVRQIVSHFEDLTRAHEAVRRARDQLAALEPLVATADRYDDALARRTALELQRDAVRLYFAELRIELLGRQLERDRASALACAAEAERVEARRDQLRSTRETLLAQRSSAGGERVSQLEQIESEARAQAEQRRSRRARFDTQVADSGLDAIDDSEAFRQLQQELPARSTRLQEQRTSLEEERGRHLENRRVLHNRGEEARAELASLAQRRNNLPAGLVQVREQLCAHLGLDVEQLPFAGELIDVGADHRSWRGAAERVLRGFAQSLLVPQDHYSGVATWINGRRLTQPRRDGSERGMRLVYERVPDRRVPLTPLDHSDTLRLADTLELASGPFTDYLQAEINKRADHRCVDTVAQLQQERRAVTREGQVRSGDRHDKDDRTRVDDPRTWILGWSNQAKVDALTEELTECQAQILEVDGTLAGLDEERSTLDAQLLALAKLEEHTSWDDLDVAAATARADEAAAERERLLAGSDRLAEIERQIEETAHETKRVEDDLARVTRESAVLDEQVNRADRARDHEKSVIARTPAEELDALRAAYPELDHRLGSDKPVDPDACPGAATEVASDLQRSIDRLGKEIGGYTQSLLHHMSDVRRQWPEATTEMDVSLEAREEFRAFRDRIATDDLPRFEEEFKHQLNTNTIRELAQFNHWLLRQADEIHDRVDRINEALGAIDYSPGHYIKLVTERTVNQEVTDFRTDLRAATSDAVSDDDHYSERRFLDVQRLIERFRGREGRAESDQAWTRRVTDVRNWVTFSASERDRESDAEWEHYRDSDGKSGGQKEKLAYTILAASLAYQFGLEWGVERARDFRFAVIDEAFGRGSDASTRYALDLFAKLGLQLLIVTPLQKVHVIEPYVHAIGFVDNPTGSYSRLHTMTIEEFRTRRAAGAN